MVIVLTSNRKLSKGGAERQGAARGEKKAIWEKIPEQLWRWGLRRMLSGDAESCSVLEKLRWSGEEETQTAVIERWWRASHSSLRVKRSGQRV